MSLKKAWSNGSTNIVLAQNSHIEVSPHIPMQLTTLFFPNLWQVLTCFMSHLFGFFQECHRNRNIQYADHWFSMKENFVCKEYLTMSGGVFVDCSGSCITGLYAWRSVAIQVLSCLRLFETHGLQLARLPCPSPSPEVCSNSYRLSWGMCHTQLFFCMSHNYSLLKTEHFEQHADTTVDVTSPVQGLLLLLLLRQLFLLHGYLLSEFPEQILQFLFFVVHGH